MSVSSQPVEFINWKPSISEIAELLQSLGISPPQSIDEYNRQGSQVSLQNSLEFHDNEETEIDNYISDSERTNESIDRETIIKELEIARNEGKLIASRNNFFHEYLVEHFKKKQMMHVYTDESEDDNLLNEYLRKLDELDRSSDNLQISQDNWNEEITRTRAVIGEKSEEARDSIEKMMDDERSVGTSTWYCGKPLVIRRVQALISRQIDRIKDIGKFRIRYTRLRDELIATELNLREIEISRPNLTKQDYERLEAEQFYYKNELRRMEKLFVELGEKRELLEHRIDSTRRRIVEITRRYDNCMNAIMDLKNTTRICLEERRCCLESLAKAKHFANEFSEIVGQSQRPEFAARISKMRDEHEMWMKKITDFLGDIKNLGQSLNAVRANLILHGKSFERDTRVAKFVMKK